MRRWVPVVIAVLAVVSAPAAAGAKSDRSPVKAASAAALVAAMADRGIDCDAFVDADDSSATALPGAPVGDTGECAVGGKTASIAVYRNAAGLRRALAAMPILCRYASAILGPVAFTFVTGPNWSVSFFRDEYDPAVGKALGARARDVDCTELVGR